MVRLGISSMFFGNIDLDEFFTLISKHEEIEIVDIWYDTPFFLLRNESAREKIIEKIKNYKESGNFETISHVASVDINPVAYNPENRKFSLNEVKKSIRFANNINSKYVSVHGGYSSFNRRFSHYDVEFYMEFLDDLTIFIKDTRLDIQVCIENDAATPSMIRPLESLSMIEDILNDYPLIGMTLDLAHVLKSTWTRDSFKVEGDRLDFEHLNEFLKKYCHRVKVVHASYPNENTTHGRIDFTDEIYFLFIIKILLNYMKREDLNVIFEYTLDEKESEDASLGMILEDFTKFKKILGVE
ncbi:MAG: sugar phosphate isomerase/epimerase family protein [Candidatus Hodarchaeota archaeon]